MTRKHEGCVQAAQGPLAPETGAAAAEAAPAAGEGGRTMSVRVGMPAPDFEATAYVGAAGFENVKLSDYAGQWVALCFYPGDFTFV
jgi:peroxiredoxin (alkyl hydroperoxide reductase subunit C)